MAHRSSALRSVPCPELGRVDLLEGLVEHSFGVVTVTLTELIPLDCRTTTRQGATSMDEPLPCEAEPS